MKISNHKQGIKPMEWSIFRIKPKRLDKAMRITEKLENHLKIV